MFEMMVNVGIHGNFTDNPKNSDIFHEDGIKFYGIFMYLEHSKEKYNTFHF